MDEAVENASGGAVQTQLNNWIYHQNSNVLTSGLNAGFAGAGGYGLGLGTSSLLGKQFANSLIPVIGANAATSTGTEATGSFINSLQEQVESKIRGDGK